MATAETKRVPSVRLGDSGLHVSRLILGCMSYGSKSWQDWVVEDQKEINAHFKAAYEMGIYTWDTANVYSQGASEIVVGKAIKELGIPREELVILTKVHGAVQTKSKQAIANGFINQKGLSRKHIFDSIRASLKRLDLDYVDVLQCHRFDPSTPFEETMQALHDVVQAGHANYIGMSSCHAYQLALMQSWAKAKGTTCFISHQPQYSAIYREEEREMLPLCKHFGIGVISWSPLARGYLGKPFTEESVRTATDANFRKNTGLIDERDTAMLQSINKQIQAIAKAKGVSMAQVALAWTLAQPGITAPIIGTTKLDSLYELVGALDVKLTAEEEESISSLYCPRKVFGFV